MSTTTTASAATGARSPRRRLLGVLGPLLIVALVISAMPGYRWWTRTR